MHEGNSSQFEDLHVSNTMLSATHLVSKINVHME